MNEGCLRTLKRAQFPLSTENITCASVPTRNDVTEFVGPAHKPMELENILGEVLIVRTGKNVSEIRK